MAVMMIYALDGVVPEQYDALRTKVGWLDTPPEGGRVHVTAFDDDGIRITDVWDSVEDFERFLTDRLAPVMAELGIDGEPTVTFLPLHEAYCPVPDTVLLTSV